MSDPSGAAVQLDKATPDSVGGGSRRQHGRWSRRRRPRQSRRM